MKSRHPRVWFASSLLLAAVLPCLGIQEAGAPPIGSETELTEMEPVPHTHHTIDYIEFVTTDMVASKRFYAAAFDWQFNDYGPEYAGIRGNGREVGGLRLDTEASNGGPLVILYSRDLDRTLQRVRDAGAPIVKEPFEFPGGRRFHFADPSGNELAVWAEK